MAMEYKPPDTNTLGHALSAPHVKCLCVCVCTCEHVLSVYKHVEMLKKMHVTVGGEGKLIEKDC